MGACDLKDMGTGGSTADSCAAMAPAGVMGAGGGRGGEGWMKNSVMAYE